MPLTKVQGGLIESTNEPVILGAGSSTGTANQPLQVTGGAYVSGNLGIRTTAPQGTLQVNSGTSSFVIDASGFVGVGTITPSSSYKLNVHGSTDAYIQVTNDTEGVGVTRGLVLGYDSSANRQIINSWSLPLVLNTSVNTAPVVIQPASLNRRVGIGSTLPNNKLDVIGDTYVSGSVGIGTTNPTDKLTVLGKIHVHQNSSSENRIILRSQPGSSYRWNIDNFGSSNLFRIFREDDATSASGAVAIEINASTRNVSLYGGNLAFDSGKGIDFSATSDGSGVIVGGEVLDDYEDGTWTPVVAGTSVAGTATYTIQNGSYVKIGKLVYINGRVAYTGHTGTGNFKITGLPYTCESNRYHALAYSFRDGLTVPANEELLVEVYPATAEIYLLSVLLGTDTAGSLAIDSAVSDFNFNGTYRIA